MTLGHYSAFYHYIKISDIDIPTKERFILACVYRGSSPRSESLIGLCWWQEHVRVHSSSTRLNRDSAHISCQDREKGKYWGHRSSFKVTLLIIQRLPTRLHHLRIHVTSQYPLLEVQAFTYRPLRESHPKHNTLVYLLFLDFVHSFVHPNMTAFNKHHWVSFYSCQ